MCLAAEHAMKECFHVSCSTTKHGPEAGAELASGHRLCIKLQCAFHLVGSTRAWIVVFNCSSQEKHVRLTVPYGSIDWELPINFTRTETGGSCQVGCHSPKDYSRK